MKHNLYKVLSTAALAAIIAGTGAAGASGSVQAASIAEAAQTEQTVNLKNVDQKLIDAAQTKLKEHAKGSVSFSKAETTEYNGEVVSLSWQKNGKLAGSVYVKPDGKVVRVYLDLKYAQLNDTLKSKLGTAWKQLYKKTAPGFTKLDVNYLEDGSTDIMAFCNNERITLVDGKVKSGGGSLKSLPAVIQKAATQALSRVGAKAKGSPRIYFSLEPNKKKVYGLEYSTNKGDIELEIEETTNRLLRIDLGYMSLTKELTEVSTENGKEETKAIRDKVNSYSLDELQKSAVKQAKEIMNLDLSGYKAARNDEDNDSEYAYHDSVVFTKKGAPTVTGFFNSKGVFSGFRIEQ
ncbi:hypothetical protein EHV15_29355 [Paenibacillus oralis]|uniref:PepSY domain-containing protein n=1 Tax=Paenibacillus oralis TaxID=2490856 RepID=A0A3P3U892_9BACL|nr:hypothetical protein [Paenibacillus oralis]RRJ66575.1 hypothetical protein EHV15_29355 [Paenibacillus oralis]